MSIGQTLTGRERPAGLERLRRLVFGMEPVAYSGPETGNRDHRAYVLRAGVVASEDPGHAWTRAGRGPRS